MSFLLFALLYYVSHSIKEGQITFNQGGQDVILKAGRIAAK